MNLCFHISLETLAEENCQQDGLLHIFSLFLKERIKRRQLNFVQNSICCSSSESRCWFTCLRSHKTDTTANKYHPTAFLFSPRRLQRDAIYNFPHYHQLPLNDGSSLSPSVLPPFPLFPHLVSPGFSLRSRFPNSLSLSSIKTSTNEKKRSQAAKRRTDDSFDVLSTTTRTTTTTVSTFCRLRRRRRRREKNLSTSSTSMVRKTKWN